MNYLRLGIGLLDTFQRQRKGSDDFNITIICFYGPSICILMLINANYYLSFARSYSFCCVIT